MIFTIAWIGRNRSACLKKPAIQPVAVETDKQVSVMGITLRIVRVFNDVLKNKFTVKIQRGKSASARLLDITLFSYSTNAESK